VEHNTQPSDESGLKYSITVFREIQREGPSVAQLEQLLLETNDREAKLTEELAVVKK